MATKFARVRTITQAVLKLKPGTPRFFYFCAPMFQGKKIDDKKEAATLIRSVDMETGEEGVLILSTIMKKELIENYPGDTYAGKGFEVCITKAADPAAGVKYNHVSLAQVALQDDFVPPAAEQGETASEAAAANAAVATKAKK
jgi:hypothetical protein